MNKPSNKIRLIWSTFALWVVCCVLSIVLDREGTIAVGVGVAFAGMTGWLFNIRYKEKEIDSSMPDMQKKV